MIGKVTAVSATWRKKFRSRLRESWKGCDAEADDAAAPAAPLLVDNVKPTANEARVSFPSAAVNPERDNNRMRIGSVHRGNLILLRIDQRLSLSVWRSRTTKRQTTITNSRYSSGIGNNRVIIEEGAYLATSEGVIAGLDPGSTIQEQRALKLKELARRIRRSGQLFNRIPVIRGVILRAQAVFSGTGNNTL